MPGSARDPCGIWTAEERVTAQHEISNGHGETVIYGFNPTSGYFIQVHDSAGLTVLHRWNLLDGLTGSELVEIAEEHGVQLPEAHTLCAMLDLPVEVWNPVVLGQ